MDESIDFYTQVLGLELDKRFSPNEFMEIAFFGKGETQFELAYNKHITELEHSKFVSTGFLVESLARTIDKMKDKGIEIVDGPYQPTPFIKFFFIEDPNGYRLQLVEQIPAEV
jgi:lactoylglutathione lyase